MVRHFVEGFHSSVSVARLEQTQKQILLWTWWDYPEVQSSFTNPGPDGAGWSTEQGAPLSSVGAYIRITATVACNEAVELCFFSVLANMPCLSTLMNVCGCRIWGSHSGGHERLASCFHTGFYSAYSLTPMMEAIYSSETLLTFSGLHGVTSKRTELFICGCVWAFYLHEQLDYLLNCICKHRM
jgi:hypothetical protein